MTTTLTPTSAMPGSDVAEKDTRLSGEFRVVGMVWQRELIRYTRNRERILSGLIQPVLFLFVLGYGMKG